MAVDLIILVLERYIGGHSPTKNEDDSAVHGPHAQPQTVAQVVQLSSLSSPCAKPPKLQPQFDASTTMRGSVSFI